MVRFSLYKRHLSGGVYYYVRFWNPEKKNYDAGISIETLRAKLGEDMLNPIESEGMNPIKPDKKAKWASGMGSLNAVNILFDGTK